MSSLGVNPTIVLAAFVVSLVLAVIVITTVDKMRSQKGGEVDSPKKAKKDKKQEATKEEPAIEQKAEKRPIAQPNGPIKKDSSTIIGKTGNEKSPEELANLNLKEDKTPVKDRLVRTLDKDNAEMELAEKEKYLQEAKEKAAEDSPIKVMSDEEITEILGDVNDDKEDEQIKRRITKSQLDEMNQLGTEPIMKPADNSKLSDDEVASLLEMVSTLSAEQFRKLPKDLQDLVARIVEDIENSEVHVEVTYASDDVPRVSGSDGNYKLYEYRTLVDGKEVEYDEHGYLTVTEGSTVLFETGVQLNVPNGTMATLRCAGVNPRLDSSYTETLSWTDKKMLSVTCKALGDAVVKKGALVAEVSF